MCIFILFLFADRSQRIFVKRLTEFWFFLNSRWKIFVLLCRIFIFLVVCVLINATYGIRFALADNCSFSMQKSFEETIHSVERSRTQKENTWWFLVPKFQYESQAPKQPCNDSSDSSCSTCVEQYLPEFYPVKLPS